MLLNLMLTRTTWLKFAWTLAINRELGCKYYTCRVVNLISANVKGTTHTKHSVQTISHSDLRKKAPTVLDFTHV